MRFLRRLAAGNRKGENPTSHYLNLRYVEKKVYSRGNKSAQGGAASWQSVMMGKSKILGRPTPD